MRKIEKIKMSKKMKNRLLILCLEAAGIIGFIVAVMMFILRLGAIYKGEIPADSERLVQDIVGLVFGVGGLLSFVSLACLPVE